jgi:hypothetical protein
MSKPSVYLETTIPSYLTAWRSRDLVTAARQQVTRDWWDTRREAFDLYVSPFVHREVRRGDAEAARLRLEALDGISELAIGEETVVLIDALISALGLPERAVTDAAHIAVAVTGGMDYLLTWNCTHIANASMRDTIERVCFDHGFDVPVICTPDELMAEQSHG